ncbi:hypothetical protein DM867_09655 [Halosegnis rubeus]|uniref:Uncharacterized protein n=1 Tax=Halosegnis rubeus TaxID=2212850 RepID=A0A5N5U7P8_9EURY|nr:hypothetical protein [Halosegnis rubeus]KAB7514031.1 hypothetical protein DM867_09655 [Halosegnis rubeus]KAB7514429.1 hypothetical protein DMP03_11290 [Halosegnis rubeus]KAB7518655.1 hypothetical protein DP108_05620 [Halosegnis rubeus]
MSTDDTRGEDPVAAALTEGSAYERLRVQRVSVFPWSLGEKLQWLGVVLLAFGVAVGAFAFVTPNGTTVPVDPGTVPTYTSMVALIALATLGLVALVLSILGVVRERDEPLSDERAETILVVEELCALTGFVTGGTTAAIAVTFCLVPFTGPEAVTWLATTLERSPYAAIETVYPIVPTTLATVALLLGAVCLLAGRRWQTQ